MENNIQSNRGDSIRSRPIEVISGVAAPNLNSSPTIAPPRTRELIDVHYPPLSSSSTRSDVVASTGLDVVASTYDVVA